MNTESLLVKINTTALFGKYTMQEAINMCRQRAMSGEVLNLYVKSEATADWVHLGLYRPSRPAVFTDFHTGESTKVPCCLIRPEPLQKKHYF